MGCDYILYGTNVYDHNCLCFYMTGLNIRRGRNPPKIYNNGCPSERDNEDILVDVLKLLSSEFGVVPLGRAKYYAAISCMQVADASPQNKAGLYWITNGTNTRQEFCNI